MNAVKIFLFIVFLAAVPALLKGASLFGKRRKEYAENVKKYSENVKKYSVTGRKFNGTVLKSVRGKPSVIILQFRDEEQKKTIVHRYEPLSKRYKKGDDITLYYNEETDAVSVEGDEPLSQNEIRCTEMAALCIVGAAACAAAAVYLLISLLV